MLAVMVVSILGATVDSKRGAKSPKGDDGSCVSGVNGVGSRDDTRQQAAVCGSEEVRARLRENKIW